MLDNVVHNLTHRRFKNTSRLSAPEQGTSVSNSFFDPRNVGNFEAGEIAPEGNYLTHYPVNAASNTAGFTIMDDMGDDKRLYFPSQVYSGENALIKQKTSGGSIGGPSSGSSSDYIYFNPYYQALLNPASHNTMSEINQPMYIPTNKLTESGISGRGTNAPSSASAVDYAMNNPYAFPSNFNGGSLGAASSGSASDYYDSNPNRVPAMQSETRHFTDFMEGGEIDWTKYLGYVRKGIEYAPKIIETAKTIHSAVQDVNKEKGVINKIGAVAKHAPKVYNDVNGTIDTIKELRNVLKNTQGSSKNTSRNSVPMYIKKSAVNKPSTTKPFKSIVDEQKDLEQEYYPNIEPYLKTVRAKTEEVKRKLALLRQKRKEEGRGNKHKKR